VARLTVEIEQFVEEIESGSADVPRRTADWRFRLLVLKSLWCIMHRVGDDPK
jgi:hypothetical protein